MYGPPGTGKTLMAKTIAKMLNSSNITKITGSDILSKWVGEAERQIRELFQPAETEWAKNGIYRYHLTRSYLFISLIFSYEEFFLLILVPFM